MGSFDNSRGIQTGVHTETSSIENKKTFVFLKDIKILLDNLLEKDAIEPVLNHEKPTGFYSTFFLVPK